MQHISGNNFNLSGTCVAFGHFDGIHRGHRAVIDTMLVEARKEGLTSVLLSYNHDKVLDGQKILTTESEKQQLLQQNGPEVMISYQIVGQDIHSESFIKDVLVGKLGAKVLVAGKNSEDLALLSQCAGPCGYRLVLCDTVEDEGKPVLSARVTEALRSSDAEATTRLLGHPYLIQGEVIYGKQLGRTVGLPTANLDFAPNKQLPHDGVYATLTRLDGLSVKGMANIGRRPSVDNFDFVTVENYLLDFSGDLYGQVLSLEVHFRVRGVQKFSGMEEVKAQVLKDIESIRAHLNTI